MSFAIRPGRRSAAPVAARAAELRVRVENRGASHADETELLVSVVDPNGFVAPDIATEVPDLAPGDSATVRVPWSPAEAGEYRVTVDDQQPYWLYGGQQDNSAVAIPSRARGGIAWRDWYSRPPGFTRSSMLWKPPSAVCTVVRDGGKARNASTTANARWIDLASVSLNTPKPIMKGSGLAIQSWNSDQMIATIMMNLVIGADGLRPPVSEDATTVAKVPNVFTGWLTP